MNFIRENVQADQNEENNTYSIGVLNIDENGDPVASAECNMFYIDNGYEKEVDKWYDLGEGVNYRSGLKPGAYYLYCRASGQYVQTEYDGEKHFFIHEDGKITYMTDEGYYCLSNGRLDEVCDGIYNRYFWDDEYDGKEVGDYIEIRHKKQSVNTTRALIKSVSGSNLYIQKKWDGPVLSDKVTFRIKWKLDIEKDVERLNDAIKVKGVDSIEILDVMLKYMHIKPGKSTTAVTMLKNEWLNKIVKNNEEGKDLTSIMKRALIGKFDDYLEIFLTEGRLRVLKGEQPYVEYTEGLSQNVSLDDDGYCYVDVILTSEENWHKTLYGMVIPSNAEVIELEGGEGSEMSFNVSTRRDDVRRIFTTIVVKNKVQEKQNKLQQPRMPERQDIVLMSKLITKNPNTGDRKVLPLVVMAGSAMVLVGTTLVLRQRKEI